MSEALHGFLVVDKPAGLTSHDVVARVRRISRARVGHAGTLDPFATGVLVLCLGVATRLAEWATEADKRYLAELTLGVETDTLDRDGQVVAERRVKVSREQLARALEPLVGTIAQVPPVYSAIKVGGEPLYRRVRRGESVVVEPRTVTIRSIQLVEWAPPRAAIDVLCSKGTYIRALARDIGESVGCGAHLSALRRLASGALTIEQALPLDDALAQIAAGRGAEALLPMEAAVARFPRIDLDTDGAQSLRNGQPLPSASISAEGSPSMLGRAHDPSGELVAIVEWRDGAWWPRKVLVR